MAKLYSSVEEAMECTRNILWKMADGLLGLGPSCFVVEYHASLFIITSRHGIREADPSIIFVEIYPGSKRGFPISNVMLPESLTDLTEVEYADFALLKVAMELLEPGDLEKIKAFNLDDRDVEQPFDFDLGTMHLRGYPKTLSTIDYEIQKIRLQAFSTEARYVAPSVLRGLHLRGLHEIILAQPELIETPNGMSGSPVIQAVLVSNSLARVHLVGMLVRASEATGIGHFIDSEFICGALKALHHTPEGEPVLFDIEDR